MDKDFQKWHLKKSELQEHGLRSYFHEREVWWCSLGMNVGFEQDGKGLQYMRPVLILKGFSREVCVVVPLTTKSRQGRFYAEISLDDGVHRQVILSQIRLIDTKRLVEKIKTIDADQFKHIKQAVIQLLE